MTLKKIAAKVGLMIEMILKTDNLKGYLHKIEAELITKALDQTNWCVTKAAKLLKVNRTTLHMKMINLGIKNGPKV